MFKSIGLVFAAVLFVSIASGVAYTAQTVDQAPPQAQQQPPQPPKDELVQAWLDKAKLAAQLANSECQGLAATRQWYSVRDEVTKRIEERQPGYTVDWSKFVVVVKRPPQAK